MFSGATFLLVHRELSFRSRLTNRWALAERAETDFNAFLEQAKEIQKNKSVQAASKQPDLAETWNDGVRKVKSYAEGTFFSDDDSEKKS
jgi:hypothetical protein